MNVVRAKMSKKRQVNYMKMIRYLLVLATVSLAVLGSGCATSKAKMAQSQTHPLSVADVESLANAGMSDSVIISQIKNSGTSYRLSAVDIIALHNAHVSDNVIEHMINTPPEAAPNAVVAAAAPAPVAVAPAYYYPPAYPYPWYWWPPVSFAFRFR